MKLYKITHYANVYQNTLRKLKKELIPNLFVHSISLSYPMTLSSVFSYDIIFYKSNISITYTL